MRPPISLTNSFLDMVDLLHLDDHGDDDRSAVNLLAEETLKGAAYLLFHGEIIGLGLDGKTLQGLLNNLFSLL
jgi:hypothetical protein